jgi:hypothetical protein
MRWAATSCARCGYDLRGLAPTGTCPECGLRYDPNAKVLRFPLYMRAVWQITLAAALTPILARLWSRAGFVLADVILVAVIFASVALACRRLLPASRRHALVVLNRDGVSLDHPDKGITVLEWRDVCAARIEGRRAKLVIESPNGSALLVLNSSVLGGTANTVRCAAEINQARALYRHTE